VNLEELLEHIQRSGLAAAVRGDSGLGWLFPEIETAHVLALALVFGSIFMVDLRLAEKSGMTVRPIANMVNHETNELFFENLEIPAGITATLAVVMVPLAIFGAQMALG